MNSRQRRKVRRTFECKPPYYCFWCRKVFTRWDDPCLCGVTLAVPVRFAVGKAKRRPLVSLTLDRFFREGTERGVKIDFNLHKPTPLERLADAGKEPDPRPPMRSWTV